MARKFAQLDWDHVRAFLAVARTGRVAAAARRLQVEHTTVSRRLAALEAQLGAPLFHRTARGYLLTPVGEGILPTAESMEHAAATIGARARESTGSQAGRVRLGMPPEFASDWLAYHVAAFRRQHPLITLQVLVGTRSLELSRGEAELTLVSLRPQQVGLLQARIARTTLALYASRQFLGRRKLQVKDVESARGLPLLVFSSAFQLLQQAGWFQPVLEAGERVVETNSTHTLVNAARQGVGVAVLPRMVARHYEELVQVSDPVAEHDIWLMTHPDFRRDPKVKVTAEFLKAAAKGPLGIV